MRALQRPARTAAVVGALVATGAAALMVTTVATASASVPGRCTTTVNVRAEPDINSRIVDLCEAGTAVTVGQSRNGFVRLTDLGGWSAEQYIEVDEPAPSAPAATPTPTPDADQFRTPPSSGSGPAADDPSANPDPDPGLDSDAPDEDEAGRGPVGDLFG